MYFFITQRLHKVNIKNKLIYSKHPKANHHLGGLEGNPHADTVSWPTALTVTLRKITDYPRKGGWAVSRPSSGLPRGCFWRSTTASPGSAAVLHQGPGEKRVFSYTHAALQARKDGQARLVFHAFAQRACASSSSSMSRSAASVLLPSCWRPAVLRGGDGRPWRAACCTFIQQPRPALHQESTTVSTINCN